MKEFELIILFFILFLFIKNAPQSLSKELWLKKYEESLEKSKDWINSLPGWMANEITDMAVSISIFIIFAITIISLCFYGIVGLTVNDFIFSIITVMYMFLLIVDFIEVLKNQNKYMSLDIKDHEFNIIRNIFKLVSDCGYHIIAIYMLLHN